MLTKLNFIKEKYLQLGNDLTNPEIIADNKRYQAIAKEYSNLEPIVTKYDEYSKVMSDLHDAEEMLHGDVDAEMKELLESEILDCKEKREKLEEEIKFLLIPQDENDDKNVIVEIRAGVGGEEASLFGADLMRMYAMYAEKCGWKVEYLDVSNTELGGIKECSFMIKGKGAYSKFKYESGVHRVQRVPETESSGRIHTSTCTVAVLPEHEEVDVEILDKDLKIDTYRSSGAGGQHVNTTDSAIRITHLPTGIVVNCQDERSQLKNKERAMSILRSKLYDYYQMQLDTEYAKNRRSQVGTGDRNERIRTYNFPQGRLTDHRINYTVYDLENFMNGNIDDLISNLSLADKKKKLEELNL